MPSTSAARYAGIPVVTYEFGEQRGRIWLAQDAEVMRQETNNLWQRRQDKPLDSGQQEQIRSLFASRQRADLWANFSRRWQGQPSQGGEQARLDLGLNSRPLVLLAANVIGDSLTLGRQVFTKSMTEWLQRSVAYFAARPDVQLVVRIHPGERYTKGPSVADVVSQALPELPAHIHLVAAGDPVNTYDLVRDRRSGAGVHHHGGHGNGDERSAGYRRRANPLPREGLHPRIRIPGRHTRQSWSSRWLHQAGST